MQNQTHIPHEDGQRSCPAIGSVCHKCGKNNHYAKYCKSQRSASGNQRQSPSGLVNAVTLSESNGEEQAEQYLYNIGSRKGLPTADVYINGTMKSMIIDTRASIDIINEAAYTKLSRSPKFNKYETKILAYRACNKLSMIGKFSSILSSKAERCTATVHVVKGSCGSLLSCKTGSRLGFVHIVNHIEHDNIIEDYPPLFSGKVGALRDYKVKLHIDMSVQPTAQPHCRIPFNIRNKVESKLAELLHDDIIKKVEEGPTPWASPIVTPPKPGNPKSYALI